MVPGAGKGDDALQVASEGKDALGGDSKGAGKGAGVVKVIGGGDAGAFAGNSEVVGELEGLVAFFFQSSGEAANERRDEGEVA
ncbi:MAG TPA: hypothetical protein VFU69_15885 [Ktedonobacterales bacterium]|nr:hypothetical protein [Ktedonobacterales bacterium]